MHKHVFNIRMGKILFVFLSIFVIQLFIKVDAQIKFVNSKCVYTQMNYTKGSVYENNLNQLLSNLAIESSSFKFYNSTFGVASNKVYGLIQCRNDLSVEVCSSCVTEGIQKLMEACPLSGEGLIWYYECILRYANRNFFSLLETLPSATMFSSGNVSNYDGFTPVLVKSMKELIKETSSAFPYFASSVANFTSFEQLYSFAQCTHDLDSFECDSCLKSGLSRMNQCCGNSTTKSVFMPSCQLRYDTHPFLSINHQSSPGKDQGKKTFIKPAVIGGIAASVSVGLLVLSVVLWICLRRNKPEEANSNVPPPLTTGLVKGDEEGLGDPECVQYDFCTLKVATRDFSDDNKLGEGGFGSVYKGTMENGEQVAIKRLSGTGGQGVNEFMAEARLLAKLQHKNLVKLMGYCSQGDERLLVYEFMLNASLDGFLFDARKRSLLDWDIRYNIIMGIAKGLQYLHEDSRLTIIHRDLKPANVLLDNEMNPKIADFGTARLFGGAQKFGSTNRIVGTRGYMAPEYMMTGEYSEKTDVYSFGIMLLEILSGQKNITFNQTPQKEELSVQVWRLWSEDRSLEITDPLLVNNCLSNDAKRCIQIGLLCVQENPEDRPKMTTVIFMLIGSSDLPLPVKPAMSSNPFPAPISATNSIGWQQRSVDWSSTNSVTMHTDMGQDLYPTPR